MKDKILDLKNNLYYLNTHLYLVLFLSTRNCFQTLRALVKLTNEPTCVAVISRGKKGTFGNMLGMPSWELVIIVFPLLTHNSTPHADE